MIIKYPKCQRETSFSLKDSISQDGEVFRCKYCGWPFSYSEK